MVTVPNKQLRMVSKALETVTPTLGDVARWIGASYPSMRAYSRGSRTPPSQTMRRLARALRAHAARVLAAADLLDAELERNP